MLAVSLLTKKRKKKNNLRDGRIWDHKNQIAHRLLFQSLLLLLLFVMSQSHTNRLKTLLPRSKTHAVYPQKRLCLQLHVSNHTHFSLRMWHDVTSIVPGNCFGLIRRHLELEIAYLFYPAREAIIAIHGVLQQLGQSLPLASLWSFKFLNAERNHCIVNIKHFDLYSFTMALISVQFFWACAPLL